MIRTITADSCESTSWNLLSRNGIVDEAFEVCHFAIETSFIWFNAGGWDGRSLLGLRLSFVHRL
jgi:hypothetical protein